MAVALRARRLFDGRSEELLNDAVVLIEDERIAACGRNVAVPRAIEVIDLGDATLSPGFIDAHTHLSIDPSNSYAQTLFDHFQREAPEQAFYAAANAQRTLHGGFTTVRDVGVLWGMDFVDVALRNAINKGLVVGPRMLVAVHLLGATGGHCDWTGGLRHNLIGRELGHADGVIDGLDAARRGVRLNVKHGADVIKFCASGGVASLADEVDTPQLTFEEVTALIDEAHRLRKKVATHCHGDRAAKDAIRAGVDSIEHGSFLQGETLEAMQQQGTYLVPTLLVGHIMSRRLDQLPGAVAVKTKAVSEALGAMFQQAVQVGVKIGLGTDSGVFPHGRNAREFGLMVSHGLSPIRALKAGTSDNAELLGLSANLGTIEPGKLADIVAMPGDPSQNIRVTEQVFFVMKGGVIAKHAPADIR